jgi:hypothetical protein
MGEEALAELGATFEGVPGLDAGTLTSALEWLAPGPSDGGDGGSFDATLEAPAGEREDRVLERLDRLGDIEPSGDGFYEGGTADARSLLAAGYELPMGVLLDDEGVPVPGHDVYSVEVGG